MGCSVVVLRLNLDKFVLLFISLLKDKVIILFLVKSVLL